jgi:hypothetical protein
MPDPKLIIQAVAAAAITAAALLLLCGSWRGPWRSARLSAGSVLGVGIGFFVGCWWLGLRPHWPPREDQDRLLLILLPAIIGLELVLAIVPALDSRNKGAGMGRWWPTWLLRLILAAGAAPILLHNSSYLVDLAGPGTREWTTVQTWLILGILAVALAGLWASLARLACRAPGRSVPFALALACAGTGITVMLSGYASGGQMGLALAGALSGAVIASLAVSEPMDVSGLLGVGIVGLFSLLVMGRFFGELAATNGVLLFFGLLVCWFPELPYIRRLGPRLRGGVRVVLTAVPVVVALLLAQQKFVADSAQNSPVSREPSIEDYMNFGK